MVGSYGLQALINDNLPIYVQDDRPAAETHYRVSFYFDPNTLAMAEGNVHEIFRGINGSVSPFQVNLLFSGGNYQILISLTKDSGGVSLSGMIPISDMPHQIVLDWRAATSPGGNNGGLTLWADGVQRANLTGVDNDTLRIESVRLGSVGGIDTGTRGVYYFDAIESWR